jgi:hypothetical protein
MSDTGCESEKWMGSTIRKKRIDLDQNPHQRLNHHLGIAGTICLVLEQVRELSTTRLSRVNRRYR